MTRRYLIINAVPHHNVAMARRVPWAGRGKYGEAGNAKLARAWQCAMLEKLSRLYIIKLIGVADFGSMSRRL